MTTQIQHKISNPSASDHIDIIGPDGVKIARKEKPANVEAFLNDIMRRYGYSFVRVVHYKPNGTSRKKLGEYIWDGAGWRDLAPQNTTTYHNVAHPISSSPYPPGYFGMQAPVPEMGLNSPFVKASLYDETKRERDEYKRKYEECREELSEKKKELEIYKIKEKLNSESNTQQIITGILTGVLQQYGAKQGQQGLNAPQNPVLAEICQTLGQMDTAVLPEFRAIINTMIQNSDFLKEIRAVEAKYGIIKTKKQ